MRTKRGGRNDRNGRTLQEGEKENPSQIEFAIAKEGKQSQRSDCASGPVSRVVSILSSGDTDSGSEFFLKGSSLTLYRSLFFVGRIT